MRSYERRLPHGDTVGQPIFVTFRLHDSLPGSRVFPPARLTGGKAFVAMDKLLDQARTGPFFLRQPEIANVVASALYHGEQKFHRYQLHSYIVMPNHVHMLVTPTIASPKWLGPLKGFCAHECNRILDRAGQAFWQDESYDHLVRSELEFGRIQRYIEQNPVTAGLALTAEQFPWSSAFGRENAA